MLNRLGVATLRILLMSFLLVIVFMQAIALPWLSGVMADDLPDEAQMRWPMLTLAIIGLGCVQIGIICTIRLLGFTRDGEVFSTQALRWVDVIIGASVAGSAVCLATLAYQSFTFAGPFMWTILLMFGALAGMGMALLMVVMRALLVQATLLRNDMAAVI